MFIALTMAQSRLSHVCGWTGIATAFSETPGGSDLPPFMREASNGAGSLRGEVLIAGTIDAAIDGAGCLARVTDRVGFITGVTNILECTVCAALGAGTNSSVYLTRLRAVPAC